MNFSTIFYRCVFFKICLFAYIWFYLFKSAVQLFYNKKIPLKQKLVETNQINFCFHLKKKKKWNDIYKLNYTSEIFPSFQILPKCFSVCLLHNFFISQRRQISIICLFFNNFIRYLKYFKRPPNWKSINEKNRRIKTVIHLR